MTDIEKTIILEISTLPSKQLGDVLKYIRYLKFSSLDSKEIERRFDESWERVRARAKELNITPEDIEAEICAVRERK